MQYLHKQDFLDRLHKLDKDVSATLSPSSRLHLMIVGGSALVLLGVSERATTDIDVIDASPGLRGLLEPYDINMRVCAYEDNFPYNYDDRLVLLFSGTSIDFFTASLEDIVISKLNSNRPKDRQDIISDAVLSAIDWTILERLATSEDETKASALSEFRYQGFLATYREYEEKYRHNKN